MKRTTIVCNPCKAGICRNRECKDCPCFKCSKTVEAKLECPRKKKAR